LEVLRLVEDNTAALRGRIQSEFNAKAQSRQDASGFFLLRNQETRNHRKDFMVSGLPYGIVFGRAFAPWRLCVKSFLPDGRLQCLAVCMVADRKVWPAARTGAKGQGPTHGRAGAGLASPAGTGAGAATIAMAQLFGIASIDEKINWRIIIR
jgi:hypothetical protein